MIKIDFTVIIQNNVEVKRLFDCSISFDSLEEFEYSKEEVRKLVLSKDSHLKKEDIQFKIK